MSGRSDRRRFLSGAALAGAGLVGAAALPGGRLAAIEPVSRTAGYKFKFSLAAYSYRNLLGGKPPKLTLFDFIDDCAKMGLEGTELTSYYFPEDLSEDYLRKIKGECFRRGLDISGTAVGNDFCHPPGEKRDANLALVKTWIDRADLMDAPVIRIFAGRAKPGQSEADANRHTVEAIEECSDYAGQRGVFLALENHGGVTATAEGILRLVREVRSPWFGVNLDTGNFHSQDVYGEVAQLAPYALNVQVKVVVERDAGKKEPSDFKRLAALLREAGYRGYVALEYEEEDDPRRACPPILERMREAFV